MIDHTDSAGSGEPVDAGGQDPSSALGNAGEGHPCPECRAGKCPNCTHESYDPETDEFGSCACNERDHIRPEEA